ncbi:CHAT domain-containing tetratricopeptide repeat protein [Mesorhizobium sp. B2-3-4]|uniref:CHAT domain-containing protein n=1 Tax=Mesorhizobium sp. B2-3-4 TaxID=2589959 RepID=UPI0015E3BAAA|nr:CHAT domain-containing tetratricopeptide repeat protein [Mesorhizobium sp. B2-3-4]
MCIVASVLVTLIVVAPLPQAQAQTPGGASQQAPAASEEALKARIDAAYTLMMDTGRFDEGYAQLRATLLDAARSDLYEFTVESYSNAGATFLNNQILDNAEEIFAEGLKTRAMQQDVAKRADFYLNYAMLKQAEKDYQGFVSMCATATNLYAHYHGQESQELLFANDVLATGVAAFGQIASAINIEQRNLKLAQRVAGTDDRFVWKLENNLADMLRQMGAPTRALQYDLAVLEKRTAYYGPDHFNVLVSANNTAQDYLDLGRYDQALRYFQQDRDVAVVLKQEGNLVEQADAWVLYTRALSGAQPLDEPTLAQLQRLTGDQSYPEILAIRIANLLAAHFAAVGDTQSSMSQFERASSIAEATYGAVHPLAFAARQAIANLKAKTNPTAAAADFAALNDDMLRWNWFQVSTAGNPIVAEASRALADDMLHDYARLAQENASVVPAFAEAVRRWPTLENEKRDLLRRLSRLIDLNDIETRHLIQTGIRLSLAYQEAASSGDSSDDPGAVQPGQVETAYQKATAQVMARYSFSQSMVDKPLPSAETLLQSSQALIDYFITRKWRADRESADPLEDERLYAIVTRKDQPPRMFDLGDPRRLIPAARTTRMADLRSSRSGQARGAVPMVDLDATFTGLYAGLIAPLESSLMGADTLFVVPDGKLFSVPFPLLRDRMGATLDDRFDVRMLTRPEALLNVGADQGLPRNGKAVLAGGLDYARGAQKGAEPLPGTRKEVDAIAAILRRDNYSTEVLTGDAAVERALRQRMEQATLAHLATHGAYRDEAEGGTNALNALWQSQVVLSRSGDRQSMKRDDDDNRLYGMEIMNWDLSDLDLLVLSACETARGEETFVGGLRGLPTAIDIAGAKRSLLTLWPVDDAGTAAFMTGFYGRLAGGQTYSQALRQTRRDARDGKISRAHDPRVWAAFVMFEN